MSRSQRPQATLQGHKVRYLEADIAFGQYALGDAAKRRQLRTLLDAGLLVLDDLFPALRSALHVVKRKQNLFSMSFTPRSSKPRRR